MSVTLTDLKKRFGEVKWASLLVGWRGFGQYRRLVTLQDIDQFASEKLMSSTESDQDIVALINVAVAESDQVEAHLANLTKREHSDCEKEIRKWVICLLEDRLSELPSDPLYALLALTDFWSGIGFPAYSPHEVQGQGNDLRPESYYTDANFRNALNRHKQWIEKESRDLRSE